MPARKQDIKDVLAGAVITALAGIPLDASKVVWRDQPNGSGAESAPQPAVPYVTLKITSGPRRIGAEDEYRMPPVDSAQVHAIFVGQRELVMSMQAFADGSSIDSSDLIQTMSEYTQLLQINGNFQRAQSTTISVTTVVDLTDYVVTVQHTTVTYTSGIGATAESIRDGLVLALDALANITAVNGASVEQFVITGLLGVTLQLLLDAKLQNVDNIEAVDLAFQRDDGELDSTELVDGTYFEPRSTMDFTFMLGIVYSDVGTSLIETVDFTGEVE